MAFKFQETQYRIRNNRVDLMTEPVHVVFIKDIKLQSHDDMKYSEIKQHAISPPIELKNKSFNKIKGELVFDADDVQVPEHLTQDAAILLIAANKYLLAYIPARDCNINPEIEITDNLSAIPRTATITWDNGPKKIFAMKY